MSRKERGIRQDVVGRPGKSVRTSGVKRRILGLPVVDVDVVVMPRILYDLADVGSVPTELGDFRRRELLETLLCRRIHADMVAVTSERGRKGVDGLADVNLRLRRLRRTPWAHLGDDHGPEHKESDDDNRIEHHPLLHHRGAGTDDLGPLALVFAVDVFDRGRLLLTLGRRVLLDRELLPKTAVVCHGVTSEIR